MAVYYTIDEQVVDVGARLDIGTPSASTTPTENQIALWLNLSQLDIVSKAINEAIPSLWAEQIILGSTFNPVHSGVDGLWCAPYSTDFIRPVSAELWKNPISEENIYPITLLHKEMSMAWQRNALYAATNSAPLGWFWNGYFHLAAGDKHASDATHIYYIQQPEKLALDSNDETALPEVFQEYMIQFAVLRAKIQDGKFEEIPALTAAYEQGIQLINMQAAQSYYGIKGR